MTNHKSNRGWSGRFCDAFLPPRIPKLQYQRLDEFVENPQKQRNDDTWHTNHLSELNQYNNT